MELLTQQRGAVMIVRPMGPLTGADAEPFKARVCELIRENLGANPAAERLLRNLLNDASAQK